jgi:transcriptional regulator of acetoin/glycerol metabolism
MFCPGDIISLEDLNFLENPPRPVPDKPASYEDFEINGRFEAYKEAKDRAIDDFTQKYITALLKKTRGNVSQGAELSGISRVALQKILKRHEIYGADYR